MNKLKKYVQNLSAQNGYLTIELTLIFQVIFFSLMLILFIGMVLYQEVKVQSLAIRASERGSVIYGSRVSDMADGEKTLEDFKIRDPYRNVPFLDGGKKKEYTDIVNAYVAGELGQGDIIPGKTENTGNYTQVEDYLIEKRIRVNIRTGYEIPVPAISEMFGHKGPFSVNTTAVSAVTDPADFVRNVDIVTDIAKQTKAFDTMEKGYEGIREALEKLTDLLQ